MKPNFNHKDLCLGCSECTNEGDRGISTQWSDCRHYYADDKGQCKLCGNPAKEPK